MLMKTVVIKRFIIVTLASVIGYITLKLVKNSEHISYAMPSTVGLGRKPADCPKGHCQKATTPKSHQPKRQPIHEATDPKGHWVIRPLPHKATVQ